MVDVFDVLALEDLGEGRSRLPVVARLCAGDGRIFGGVLAAAAGAAAARATPDRAMALLSTEFLAPASVGDELTLEQRTRSSRRIMTTSEIVCSAPDRIVCVASCIQVEPPSERKNEFTAPAPHVPAPSQCPPRTYRWPDPASISSWLEVRVAREAYGQGRALLWIRLHGIEHQRGPVLAIASDHVAFVAGMMLGTGVRMWTVEQSVRFCAATGEQSEWVLVEVVLDAIDERVVHGQARTWTADGCLTALSQQTLLITAGRGNPAGEEGTHE
jgi:acyl-CoA thioesterase